MTREQVRDFCFGAREVARKNVERWIRFANVESEDIKYFAQITVEVTGQKHIIMKSPSSDLLTKFCMLQLFPLTTLYTGSHSIVLSLLHKYTTDNTPRSIHRVSRETVFGPAHHKLRILGRTNTYPE